MFQFFSDLFSILPTQIAATVMLAVCALALLIGRRLERWLAVATVAAWFISAAVQTPDRAAVQWGIFTVDIVYLLFLIALCAVERRAWILFMTAFQLLVVLTHVAFIIDLTLMQWSFFSTYYLWSDAELVAFAVGVGQAGWGRWSARKV
ncbi:hypothetical protein ASD21_09495 [Caulobacter sp. Root1455]|jgi:hypothetical protein|uniref:hypothetical protein n=1 Tax=Caulobacter sp. Root1455 TaxID=1736465 RepID=UPI0006F299C2|nr:hypothetical protein [Caulobacter sp. Root1455]KQY93814.1 hypothetical protein ASD21_09495 [Caulobacter sp. Root1455]